ncbi:polysaccharide deacetylase family protein [Paenibacillus sp. FA6]|uniref:polysaccharide deacetylase family protein n=1 Tax=Paenibacillus sp. FA6 TaxID=3413029 RepID=UPI003F65CC33
MDKASSTNYIHIKFTFEQIFLLQWEIDSYTADHISAITEVAENIKYRLSLQSYYNVSHSHYYSYITTYDREHSNKIMFPCSQAYAAKISSLRDIESPDQLSSTAPMIHQQHVSEFNKEPGEIKGLRPLKVSRLKPILSRVLVMTAILTMLSFIYLPSYSYISEKVFAKLITVAPDLAEPTYLEPEVTLEMKESDHSNPAKVVSMSLPVVTKPSEEKELPEKHTVQLNDSISFSVPPGFVAITFDDGPSIYTKEIVNVLNKYNVGGTFFFVGTQVQKFPESVKYVDDHGFSIGNHSMTHSNLSNLSAEKQLSELVRTNQLIQNITSKPVHLFRPPYGSRDDKLSELMAKENMRMVLWNNDPEDWHNDSPQQTLNYISRTRSTGAIILLHESKATLDILPMIIEYLQKEQLKISSLI